MTPSDVLTFAPAALVVGCLLYLSSRQNRSAAAMGVRIREELGKQESLTLPELVERLGMNDTVINRGKLINALNPLVAAGEVVQDQPAAVVMKERLDDMRFRLPKG